MKIRELFEYRSAPRPSPLNPTDVETNLEMSQPFAKFKSKTREMQINQYSYDSRNICFICTFENKIAAYILLQKYRNKFWKVLDVDVYKNYRQDGIALGLYITLISHGFNLMNGSSLSKEIEGLWLKLPSVVTVKTYDVEANKLKPYDLTPKDEKGSDNQQRFYWVASK